jgi:hypothetical protein
VLLSSVLSQVFWRSLCSMVGFFEGENPYDYISITKYINIINYTQRKGQRV